ncbi:HEPN domain-containing protein [Sulfolobus sp. S-194]|uniref:HEPN domain-containing protein n=1 Tax=Sulfolobus sp. S-194 TaxID=2512240 RepID=UPI001436FF2B|nr:HEPN domain-containing protein [Sulfolobus sp. S-194]QIW24673.1 HEPN domain-containing protein [Sulfolobus sp. S-194]
MKKYEILLKEARSDAEIHNYNKSVSSLYFAVRKRLEDLLKLLKRDFPRRDDKLANVLRHLGYPDESRMFMRLYELRKKADYSDDCITEDELTKAFELAEKILNTLDKIYKDNKIN